MYFSIYNLHSLKVYHDPAIITRLKFILLHLSTCTYIYIQFLHKGNRYFMNHYQKQIKKHKIRETKSIYVQSNNRAYDKTWIIQIIKWSVIFFENQMLWKGTISHHHEWYHPIILGSQCTFRCVQAQYMYKFRTAAPIHIEYIQCTLFNWYVFQYTITCMLNCKLVLYTLMKICIQQFKSNVWKLHRE